MLWFPILSPPPAPPAPARLPEALRSLTPAPRWLRPARLLAPARFPAASPRAEPPNLFAVARSPYGAPPRWLGLCCHVLLPRPPAPLPPRLMLLTLFRLLTL